MFYFTFRDDVWYNIDSGAQDSGTLELGAPRSHQGRQTQDHTVIIPETDYEQVQKPRKVSITVDDSFASNTSSDRSIRSYRPSLSVADSHVTNTESAKMTKTISSRPSVTVGDSHVTNTESAKMTKTISSRSSITVGDSFVKDTSSNEVFRSPRPSITLSESSSGGDGSDSAKSRRQCRSKVKAGRTFATETQTVSPNRSVKPSFQVADSFVPETVTTVPETAQQSVKPHTFRSTRRSPADSGEEKRKSPNQEEDAHPGPDLSILDGIL